MTQPENDKSETDVDDDPKVASPRAGKECDDDGTYVGQTGPDDALDVGESGAEARSQGG